MASPVAGKVCVVTGGGQMFGSSRVPDLEKDGHIFNGIWSEMGMLAPTILLWPSCQLVAGGSGIGQLVNPRLNREFRACTWLRQVVKWIELKCWYFEIAHQHDATFLCESMLQDESLCHVFHCIGCCGGRLNLHLFPPGAALCQHFAALGAKTVVVADLNEDSARQVADQIKGLAVRCDVTQEMGWLTWDKNQVGSNVVKIWVQQLRDNAKYTFGTLLLSNSVFSPCKTFFFSMTQRHPNKTYRWT